MRLVLSLSAVLSWVVRRWLRKWLSSGHHLHVLRHLPHLQLHNPAKEHLVQQLIQLPRPQLERALQYLANPQEQYPPKELRHLNQVEWQVLQLLLQKLEWEKKNSPLH
jgi:hypothetical protein